MKPERFRAYAVEQTVSRRLIDGEKANIDHPVENVAFQGKVADGIAAFDAGETMITRLVFLAGPLAEEVCVGAVDVNKSGQISLEYVEADHVA